MRWVRPITALAGLIVVGAAAGWPFYVSPARDTLEPARPADAVVALGGNPGTAYYAQQLVRRGEARTLVVSDPYGKWENPLIPLCRPAPPGTTCFVPSPSTTRGEAREIGELARVNGWDDVVVVAPTFHISRARMIVERCYPGELRMVDPHLPYPIYRWPYEYVYQSFGFAKAAVLRGC